MAWLHIGKEFRFEAAHQLYDGRWDNDRNFEEFGKCSRLHGHSYVLEVQVGGHTDTTHNWVMDYAELSRIVNATVIDLWDHEFLNELPEFKRDSVLTTAENMCLIVWRLVEDFLPVGVLLERVRIKETAKTFAELTR
jgi:6-pyruvoyltetrahydropterin/6-carboxytetrahydropterin synthase